MKFLRALFVACILTIGLSDCEACGASHTLNLRDVAPADLDRDEAKIRGPVGTGDYTVDVHPYDLRRPALAGVLQRLLLVRRNGAAFELTNLGKRTTTDASRDSFTAKIGHIQSVLPFSSARDLNNCEEVPVQYREYDFNQRVTNLTQVGAALLHAGLLERVDGLHHNVARWQGSTELLRETFSYPLQQPSEALIRGESIAFPWSQSVR